MHVFKPKKLFIMIKKILFVSVLAIFVIACNEDSNDVENNNDTTIVAGAEAPSINLVDFEAKAGEFVGKKINITGIVDHVCKHGGKKILLVDGDNSLHIFNDERFDEEIAGSNISLTGIVEEEKIDEAYLTEWWNHSQESHSEGTENDIAHLAEVEEMIQDIRDSLKSEGVEYFPEYSLKYVSHEEIKEEK